MEAHPFSFPKREHLYGDTTVDRLHKKGKSFLAFPVKVTYLITTDEQPVRCMMVAPKKRFKHAVDRNRVKRQLREVYRHHKQELIDWSIATGKQVHIAMVCVSDKLLPQRVMERKVSSALTKIAERLNEVHKVQPSNNG